MDLAKTGATKATKTLKMPPPWTSSTIIRVAKVAWKLSNNVPATRDVKQGALPNCPIAAILAALAHTAVGQKYLDGMVTEYVGTQVKTVLPPDIVTAVNKPTADDPDYRPQEREIASNRYFTVKLGKELEVHDTFYVKYTDGTETDLVFMDSPSQVLWPCVIEKACALQYGSYVEIGNYRKHTANDFWGTVVGSKPQGFAVTDTTDLEKIRDAARQAPRVPTIGASREGATKVTGWHGFAVLGLKDATIELYDPAKAKQLQLSLEDFRSSFQVVLFGNP